ncbi:MAG: hypothetical protein GXO98_00765 [Nitrospirae bacterium]|nr:hypothetical protein [Nitrospirota bacterium]
MHAPAEELTLIPNMIPKTDIEKAVCKAISDRKVSSVLELEDYVADCLFTNEVAGGVVMAGIGDIGPQAFLEDAIRIIQSLNGRLITIKKR